MADERTDGATGEGLLGAPLPEAELARIEVVPRTVPPPEPAPPPSAAPPAIEPGTEMAVIAQALVGIQAELKRLNDQVAALVEPPVLLNHYRKGAALRIDESHSRVHNPTF